MGFNSVYRTLQELFPQLDSRLLKAVAIEHSKDADTAAEVVLSEVLPYMSKQSMVSSSSAALSSSSESQIARPLSVGEEEDEEQINLLRRQRVRKRESDGLSSEPKLMATEDASVADCTSGAHHAVSTHPERALNESAVSNFYDASDSNVQLCDNKESDEQFSLAKDQEVSIRVADQISGAMSFTLMHGDGATDNHYQVCGNIENEEVILLGNCKEVEPEQTPHIMSSTSVHKDGVVSSSMNDLHYEWKDFDGPTANDFDTLIHRKNGQVELCLDRTPSAVDNSAAQLVLDSTRLVVENSVDQLFQSSIQECVPDAPENCLHSETGSCIPLTDSEKPEACGSIDLISKQDETVEIEDESTLNNRVSRSAQICTIDLLEGIIEDAKNNKKTLFSSMESVMNMMREVEAQEKAAERAKEEAVRGGLDILTKVEELKQMVVNAKGANDMHAGEVYGEKAILATELKELQSRTLSLSDERDKSLAILGEMHKALDARLAAAEEIRIAAEQEKLEKEELARNALAEQEAIMEKVVQESKILQGEAEANSKLQEFLMDRGRIVDMLQGEISVICQDVRLMKEKFDERVPLCKSISSSQTTCILASSSSSLKSVASDLVIEQGEALKTPMRMSPTHSVDDMLPMSGIGGGAPNTLKTSSPTPSIDRQSLKSRLENDRARVAYKALLDDDWYFLDNGAAEL